MVSVGLLCLSGLKQGGRGGTWLDMRLRIPEAPKKPQHHLLFVSSWMGSTLTSHRVIEELVEGEWRIWRFRQCSGFMKLGGHGCYGGDVGFTLQCLSGLPVKEVRSGLTVGVWQFKGFGTYA